MVFSFSRSAIGAVVIFAIALGAVPTEAPARELATARGAIAISEAGPGLRAPLCSELLIEARDALDNHLIAETQPSIDESGACRYALTVPAQTAVWLRLQPVLVTGVRIPSGANINTTALGHAHSPSGSVALRFTIIAPTTYFFAPGELKTILLSY